MNDVPDETVPNVTLLKLAADNKVIKVLEGETKLFHTIFCKSRMPEFKVNVDPVVVNVPTFVYFNVFVELLKTTVGPITIEPAGELNSRSIPTGPAAPHVQVPEPVILRLAVPDIVGVFACVKFLVIFTVNPTPFMAAVVPPSPDGVSRSRIVTLLSSVSVAIPIVRSFHTKLPALRVADPLMYKYPVAVNVNADVHKVRFPLPTIILVAVIAPLGLFIVMSIP